MRTKVLPALADLDDKLAVKPAEPGEAQKMIRQIVRSVAKGSGVREKQLEEAGH
jgi:hypothetical protein